MITREMNLRSRTEKCAKLVEIQRRFQRACRQIIMLNNRLTELNRRYGAARRENLRPFRYTLRLRLAVVEGMRNVYYDYAHQKADEMAALRKELFGEHVIVIDQ